MHLPRDMAYMQHALRLATRQLGLTAPNPAVGCVVVRDGAIVGVGATGDGGRPHAETQALAMAGSLAEGAHLYVTLEPCSHYGQTPPCTEAIIKAGITRVYCATTDVDARVCGRGIAALREAGITVFTGACEHEAQSLNEGFFLSILHKRPLVAMKIATSLDGKMALQTGESQWITGQSARRFGHMLRAQHDAILTGIATVLTDNPALTCRLDGLSERSPIRVIADTQLRLPLDSQLAQTARLVPVWVITADERAASPHAAALRDAGVTVLPCATTPTGRIDLAQAIALLCEYGVTRLLVEAGSTLSTSLLRQALVDRLYWFRAPIFIGHDGLSAIADLAHASLAQTTRLSAERAISLGDDLCEVYRLRPCLPASSPILAA